MKDTLSKKVGTNYKAKLEKIPVIEGFMEAGWCSGYATRAAKELFGIKFNRGHAWNLRYSNLAISAEGDKLRDQLKAANKGDLIGIYFPVSKYNGQNDSSGEIRLYTHVALNLGEDEKGQYRILHNFNGPREEVLEDFLNRKSCKVKEIIKGKK
jgi:hypothetical protein